MNILFISPNSPFLSVGGVERYIKNLIDFCSTSPSPGKRIFLLPSAQENRCERVGTVDVYTRDFLQLSSVDSSGKIQLHSSSQQIKEKSELFFNFINNLIDSESIDIITAENFHMGLPPAFSLMLNMACHAKKIPLVLRAHSFATRPIHEEILKTLFWEKIICVSTSVAGDCYNKGVEVNKLTTNYLGVNTQEFAASGDIFWLKDKLSLPRNSRVVLAASRIVTGTKEILKEKGLVNLIEAFARISAQFSDTTLVFAVGTPPAALNSEFNSSLEKLKGFAKLYGIADKVICHPFSLGEMPQVYRGADLFVLPSENETLGQVYIEAMASGVPVIGTNVGGIPEIIHDRENGFLVSPNDASQLSLKISQLLTDHQLRGSFISNGLKVVNEKFEMGKLDSELFNCFTTLIP